MARHPDVNTMGLCGILGGPAGGVLSQAVPQVAAYVDDAHLAALASPFRAAGFAIGHAYRARRVHRLIAAGKQVEADRVIERLAWEAEVYRRRVEVRPDQPSAREVETS